LYERLTGRLPFDALDALEWVHCHMTRRPMPPARLVPDLALALQRILLRSLASSRTSGTRWRVRVAAFDRCIAELTVTGRITSFSPDGRSIRSGRLRRLIDRTASIRQRMRPAAAARQATPYAEPECPATATRQASTASCGITSGSA
jgi:hypothetical protein